MARENSIWTDKKRPIFGLPLSFTKYELTKDRMFINTGILSTREDEVRLYRILDVQLTRSLGQRIFGVGTIHIKSSDKSLKSFDIISVKDSSSVKEKISQAVEAERQRTRVVNREMMGSVDDDDDDFENENN